MYPYQSGSIRLDGQEITELNRQWQRAQIGVVLQDLFLYSRITETGSHAELMAARGHYYDLYRQQSLQESSADLHPKDPLTA